MLGLYRYRTKAWQVLGSNDLVFETFGYEGSNGSVFESIEYRSLGTVSDVYICGATLTTLDIVFNLIYYIDLLATEQRISLYRTY